MASVLRDLYDRRDLLSILVMRNIKIRYKSSALGFLWTLLNPIFLIVIYAVFLGLLKVKIQLPLLVSGIIVWSYLDLSLGDSLYAIIGNTNLIKKTSFPRIILPAAMVIGNLVNFLLSLAVLAAYLLIMRMLSVSYIAMLPVVVLTHAALCLGLACMVSALNVYFRDTEHILGIVKLAWFFLTPIVYPLDFIFAHIPERLHWLQKLAFVNPMTGIVTFYRTATMGTDLVAPDLVLISLAISWGIFFLGILFFQKAQVGFADEL